MNTRSSFQVGQPVQHLLTDFKSAGMPKVWRDGVIVAVDQFDGGLLNVQVRTSHDGIARRELVGKRGGNSNFRFAS